MQARDIPPHLHARYGIEPPSRWRWLGWAVLVVVVAPVLAYAASRYVATQSATYAVYSWSASAGDTEISVTFHTSTSAGRKWCAVRAQDFNHFDVGFAVVPVAGATTSTTFTMATLARPVAVDVIDCGPDPYALPGAQFEPGVKPPAQRPPAFAPGVYSPEQLAALR